MQIDGLDRPIPARPQPLPVQDLAFYEAHGGHTLHRHVNTKPGDELRRIRNDGVAAAGTFLSAGTAQRCVSVAINRRREQVLEWLQGRERGAPFTFVVDMGQVVGRTLTWEDVRRGETTPRQVTAVRVVLRRRPELPGGFTVVTAYPTRVSRRRANGYLRRGQ